MTRQTRVLVIGGGLTGAGVLRDLALRGIDAVLVERRDINAGASGANHGLLHSGGRYVVTDPQSAQECMAENAVLRRVAAACVEDTGGLFVQLPSDDPDYAERFLAASEQVGLRAQEIEVAEALAEEPFLNQAVRRAIRVPDASINPFMATSANLADAEAHGAKVLLHTEVRAIEQAAGRIVRVRCVDHQTGEDLLIEAEQVVSAAGAWVSHIGSLAGVRIPIAFSKGSLVITNSRLANHVLNRLRPPADADIIVPGESVTITGTTSIRVDRLEHLRAGAAEVDLLVRGAAQIVPRMADARYIRVYSGVRPLVQSGDGGADRALSRTFVVFDHATDGLDNFATIAGGKLTTYRLMAERVTDLVCQRMGVTTPCITAERPLPGSESARTLDPRDRLGRLQRASSWSPLLCECEMVSREEVDAICDREHVAGRPLSPNGIRLRSRLGMGSCQGGFCGYRTIARLYERGELADGNAMLVRFLEKRWAGIRPMLWGGQLRQEQLLEAIYCGTLNIDGEL